jgi:RNA-binding protein Luc7-like 2
MFFSNYIFKNKFFLSTFKAMDHLTTFVGECDRKTEAAKKRLAETQEELSAEVAAKAQKVLSSIRDKNPKQNV